MRIVVLLVLCFSFQAFSETNQDKAVKNAILKWSALELECSECESGVVSGTAYCRGIHLRFNKIKNDPYRLDALYETEGREEGKSSKVLAELLNGKAQILRVFDPGTPGSIGRPELTYFHIHFNHELTDFLPLLNFKGIEKKHALSDTITCIAKTTKSKK